MADVAERLAKAREHVAPGWTPERERTVREGIERGMRRAQRRRAASLAAGALVLSAVLLVAIGRFASRAPVATAPREVTAPTLVQFEDGSAVTASSPGARVEPIEVAPRAVSVRLTNGAARFSITPNPERTFRVVAGNVTVTVLGTIFTVNLERRGVKVAVERGRVHVAWPAGERDVGVGEQTTVADGVAPPRTDTSPEPAPPAPAEPAAPIEPSPDRAPAASPDRQSRAGAPASWRSLAQDGDYAGAYARMTAEGPDTVHDEPGDLLLAADVSRLSGHPEKAVAWLDKVVKSHASDSRAPLSAFTLGRTLLDQLGRPREAAQAFAAARRLDPKGALAQDALAREVECWSRAGEATLARERAETYVGQYPKGRRAAAVRRLGGLE